MPDAAVPTDGRGQLDLCALTVRGCNDLRVIHVLERCYIEQTAKRADTGQDRLIVCAANSFFHAINRVVPRIDIHTRGRVLRRCHLVLSSVRRAMSLRYCIPSNEILSILE